MRLLWQLSAYSEKMNYAGSSRLFLTKPGNPVSMQVHPCKMKYCRRYLRCTLSHIAGSGRTSEAVFGLQGGWVRTIWSPGEGRKAKDGVGAMGGR